MKKYLSFVIIIFVFKNVSSQVVLVADGPGNTYELINSKLANSGRDVVETPDCVHTAFGKHIDEVFDNDLNKFVFRFHAHVSPDNDRCKTFDRQRTEIKSYDSSPENLKAVLGETVEYKWKFKISNTFKPSTSFTHIHQIKAVGGAYEAIPMITLTLRKSSPDRLELRYTPTNNQTTLKTADLDLFRGNWVEVYERITYEQTGSYAIEIKNVSTNQVIFSYSNTSIDTWQDGASFSRPKWGIYRSLNNLQDLQDEMVLFADFSIEEITGSLSVDELKKMADKIVLFPNPASEEIIFKNTTPDIYDSIEVYDISGRKISIENRLKQNKLKVSDLLKGMYFITFKKDKTITKTVKFVVK